MSNKPISERTPAERTLLANFARNLSERMARAGLSQSDVARAIWGVTQDARGQDVARNRDRISHYVRGSQMPETQTLKRLAEVLNCDIEDLVPIDHAVPGAAVAPPDVTMTTVGGRPDLALITLSKMIPTTYAVKILGLVAEADLEMKAARKIK